MGEHCQSLGESAALQDGGLGLRARIHGGQVLPDGAAEGLPVFVIRHAGQLHGWVNHCPHRGTELDWEPGAFFDDEGLLLVCATHGALFEPDTGRCIAGPCRGASLQRVEVQEGDGRITLQSAQL